jgi:hypothetical protein
MNEIDQVADELRKNITNFIVPLQTTRVVRADAFEAINRSARTLARILRGSPLVQKSLLNELFVTAQILRAEAPYLKGESAKLSGMADQIETTFALILKGEAHEDRVPGVPRVI